MFAWRTMLAAAGTMGALMLATPVNAAEIVLLSSTAMRESLEELVPAFEKASGHKVTIIFKSGVDVSAALRAGDQADLVVSTDTALDELVKEGKVVAGSRVDFARPRVGVAVKAGAPKPDISTPDGFRNALLKAKSIGYSKGPSGIHLEGVMKRLGIFDQVKAEADPAGARRARRLDGRARRSRDRRAADQRAVADPRHRFRRPAAGRAADGAVSIRLGIAGTAKERDAARALVKFLTSEAALPVFKKLGMDPA